MEYVTNKVGCESLNGTTPEEAAWRFFARNPSARRVQVQGWSKTETGSELVSVDTLSKADVRRRIPGALQSA
jgi:hypothetical protein